MKYVKNLISITTFSLILVGFIFINSNLAQGAPICGVDGYDDPNDPACYTTYTYTVTGSHGGCWYTGTCNDSLFGIVPDLVPCYWLAIACADGATGSWCVNHPCGLACADAYSYTATDYTCHYISAVNTWSECADGVQLATDVTWSTKPYVAATCVNVALSRICPVIADIKVNGNDGPITVDHDNPVTISWESSGADYCAVTNNITSDLWKDILGSETRTLAPNDYTYTQDCTGPGANDSDNVNVCVADCSLDSNEHCVGDLYNGKCGQACIGTMPNHTCGPWSDCSQDCGSDGVQTRTCVCPDKADTQACNSHPCPPSYREVTPW